MFVLIGVNVKVMPPVQVAKSSEVLVSLVSCTLNPESVLNLRTRKPDWVSRCLLHLCHVRLVMSVVLFSVRDIRRVPWTSDLGGKDNIPSNWKLTALH